MDESHCLLIVGNHCVEFTLCTIIGPTCGFQIICGRHWGGGVKPCVP